MIHFSTFLEFVRVPKKSCDANKLRMATKDELVKLSNSAFWPWYQQAAMACQAQITRQAKAGQALCAVALQPTPQIQCDARYTAAQTGMPAYPAYPAIPPSASHAISSKTQKRVSNMKLAPRHQASSQAALPTAAGTTINTTSASTPPGFVAGQRIVVTAPFVSSQMTFQDRVVTTRSYNPASVQAGAVGVITEKSTFPCFGEFTCCRLEGYPDELMVSGHALRSLQVVQSESTLVAPTPYKVGQRVEVMARFVIPRAYRQADLVDACSYRSMLDRVSSASDAANSIDAGVEGVIKGHVDPRGLNLLAIDFTIDGHVVKKTVPARKIQLRVIPTDVSGGATSTDGRSTAPSSSS